MKKNDFIVFVSATFIAASFIFPQTTFAANVDRSSGKLDPRLVFEIGGKSKIKKRRNREIPLGAGVRWQNPVCSAFDPSLSITNILNGVTGSLEKIQDDLIASATGVVSNWAMIEIARADPELYQFIQQGKLEASQLFNASVASCEEMTDKVINQGYNVAGSPGSWVEVSGFEAWGDADTVDDDAVALNKKIDETKGDDGITWMGGDKAGGKNQPAIDTVSDAVKAGVNLLAKRDVKSNAKLPDVSKESSPWFTKYWSTPAEASKWITEIVGETTIQTCVDCERLKTTPGKGVYGWLEERQSQIELKVMQLVSGSSANYDLDVLSEISAPGYEVTQQVIEALKGEELYQDTLIERLAEEVATADAVERLIAARRILLSGKRESYIAKNSDAIEIIDNRIKEISEEMSLLRQDAELRTSTKNSIGLFLLERKSSREKYSQDDSPNRVKESLRNITGTGTGNK
ncbi:integrating conjugative element protein [Shewanella bicestrii]